MEGELTRYFDSLSSIHFLKSNLTPKFINIIYFFLLFISNQIHHYTLFGSTRMRSRNILIEWKGEENKGKRDTFWLNKW